MQPPLLPVGDSAELIRVGKHELLHIALLQLFPWQSKDQDTVAMRTVVAKVVSLFLK